MATVTNGKRGKVITVDKGEWAKLAHRFASAMDGRTITQLSHDSTLSPNTISARMRERESVEERFSVWSLVALCDAMSMRPNTITRLIGVTLSKEELRHAREVVQRRQARARSRRLKFKSITPTTQERINGRLRTLMLRTVHDEVERALSEYLTV